jgi:hypothetical protein
LIRKIFFGIEFKIDSDLLSFDVITLSWPTDPSIFNYIASLVAKLPISGWINPVKMALAIFLKSCVAQTSESLPATFSLPRTLKPRKLELILLSRQIFIELNIESCTHSTRIALSPIFYMGFSI